VSGAAALPGSALSRITNDDTDWTKQAQAEATPADYYCDSDGSGEVEAAEQTEQNLAWDFQAAGQLPALRCTPGGAAQQHR
jgi:hypothetical protein